MTTREAHRDQQTHQEFISPQAMKRIVGAVVALAGSVVGAEYIISHFMVTDERTPINTFPEVPPIVQDCDAVLDLDSSMYFDTRGVLLDQDKIPMGDIANDNEPVGPVQFRNGKVIPNAACVDKNE